MKKAVFSPQVLYLLTNTDTKLITSQKSKSRMYKHFCGVFNILLFYQSTGQEPTMCTLYSNNSHHHLMKFSTSVQQKWVRVVGEHGISDSDTSWVFINRLHGDQETQKLAVSSMPHTSFQGKKKKKNIRLSSLFHTRYKSLSLYYFRQTLV